MLPSIFQLKNAPCGLLTCRHMQRSLRDGGLHYSLLKEKGLASSVHRHLLSSSSVVWAASWWLLFVVRNALVPCAVSLLWVRSAALSFLHPVHGSSSDWCSHSIQDLFSLACFQLPSCPEAVILCFFPKNITTVNSLQTSCCSIMTLTWTLFDGSLTV